MHGSAKSWLMVKATCEFPVVLTLDVGAAMTAGRRARSAKLRSFDVGILVI